MLNRTETHNDQNNILYRFNEFFENIYKNLIKIRINYYILNMILLKHFYYAFIIKMI